jgi:hypothetical protein
MGIVFGKGLLMADGYSFWKGAVLVADGYSYSKHFLWMV